MAKPTKIDALKGAPYNPLSWTDRSASGLAVSLQEFGDISGITFNERTGHLVSGHFRVAQLRKLYGDDLPIKDGAIHAPDGKTFAVRFVDWDKAKEKRANVAANNPHIGGDFDSSFRGLLDEIQADNSVMFEALNFDELMNNMDKDLSPGKGNGMLVRNWGIAPFSVFDSRTGEWQDRKKQWKLLIGDSEKGRGDSLLKYSETLVTDTLKGVSIFDPVLCEIIYNWFTCKGATVLDPFAGGHVRGIMAGLLGRNYLGIEIRQEQVEANRGQCEAIKSECVPAYILGDAVKGLSEGEFDLVFSCPPYWNLERYSDDPADLSNMPLTEFLAAYRTAISKAVSRLKPDRFACFVVGDVRDKSGNYIDFPGETIQAFIDSGMKFYNEIVLINIAGSAALKAGKQMKVSRKVVKTHQNVLVFVKGDARKATQWCGDVYLPELLDGEIETERGNAD